MPSARLRTGAQAGKWMTVSHSAAKVFTTGTRLPGSGAGSRRVALEGGLAEQGAQAVLTLMDRGGEGVQMGC
jgi:hypothetical protein